MEYNRFFVSISIVLFIICFLCFYVLKNRKFEFNFLNIIGLICVYIFSIFGFYDTDFFHYKQIFDENLVERKANLHLENIYLLLINFIDNSYILFRIIIWGGALSLFICTIKRLQLKLNTTIFFFICIFLIKFSYSRVALAISMLFYGISFFVIPNRNKLFSYFLGMLLLILSFFLHKSAVFGLAILVLSILSIRLNKKIFLIFLLLFPIAIYLSNNYLYEYILNMFPESTDLLYVTTIQNYMHAAEKSYGVSGIILNTFQYTTYYLIFLLCIITFIKKIKLPYSINIYLISCFFIIFFSTICFFSKGVNTNTIAYRLMYFIMIPAPIFLSYYYNNGIYVRYIKITYCIGFFSIFFSLLYSFYISGIK